MNFEILKEEYRKVGINFDAPVRTTAIYELSMNTRFYDAQRKAGVRSWIERHQKAMANRGAA